MLKSYDLALLLDMSPDDINLKARKGVIKGYKKGKQWRFSRKEARRLLIDRDKEVFSRS